MKNKNHKSHHLFSAVTLSLLFSIGTTNAYVPTDIYGNRTGPYLETSTQTGPAIEPTTAQSPAINADTVVPHNTCIDVERQRFCGIEARDWCRQNLQSDACQKMISDLNLNSPVRR